MARARHRVEPAGDAELAEQRLDAGMQRFARLVARSALALEKHDVEPPQRALDGGGAAGRPAADDQDVGIDASRCHDPSRRKITSRPSLKATT